MMRRLLLLIAMLLAGAPANAAWTYYRSITVDHTKVPNTDQSNFPVLVSGAYSWLATVANGGRLESAGGYDVIFTMDTACSATLSYERESWGAATGAAVYWVKIPSLSHTADTVFYICYGNASIAGDMSDPTNVWDANYKGVWHLKDGATLSVTDATSTGNNGTNNGLTAASGQIDGGATGGASKYAGTGMTGFPAGSASRTISAWVYKTDAASLEVAFGYGAAALDQASGIYVDHLTPYAWAYGANDFACTTNISSSTWAYVAVRYDGTSASCYVNGAAAGSGARSMNTGASFAAISGDIGDSNFWWTGKLDEIRVSNTVRSADWISTEYSSQNSPDTFYSVGAETTVSGGASGSPVRRRIVQ